MAKHEAIPVGGYVCEAILQPTVERNQIVDRFECAAAILSLHRQLQPDHLERARSHQHQALGELIASHRAKRLTLSRRAFDLHFPHPTRPN